jgi:hypothetical protein
MTGFAKSVDERAVENRKNPGLKDQGFFKKGVAEKRYGKP